MAVVDDLLVSVCWLADSERREPGVHCVHAGVAAGKYLVCHGSVGLSDFELQEEDVN